MFTKHFLNTRAFCQLNVELHFSGEILSPNSIEYNSLKPTEEKREEQREAKRKRREPRAECLELSQSRAGPRTPMPTKKPCLAVSCEFQN